MPHPDENESEMPAGMAGFPSPDEFAQRLHNYATGDGVGVYDDTMTDFMEQAGELAQKFQSMYIQMDGVIDDPEVIPDELLDRMLETHQQMSRQSRYFEALYTELRRLKEDDE